MMNRVRKALMISVVMVATVGSAQVSLAPIVYAQQAVQRIPVSAILSRLDQLERDVSVLRSQPSGASDDVAVRIDQIETELRRLTGLLERLEFEMTRHAERANKRAIDLETRLDALESRGSEAFASRTAPPVQQPVPTSPIVNLTEPILPDPTVKLGGAPAVAFGGPSQFDTSPDLSALPSPVGGQQGVAIAGAGQIPNTQPTTRIQPTAPAVFTPPTVTGAQNQYDEALQLLNLGSFDEAGAAFETLVSQYPQHPVSGSAKFWLGDMHLRLGRFNEAAKAFLESFRGWPEGPKAPDSLLKLGMTLSGLGQREEACLTFTEVPVRYPNASQALLRRAEIEAQRTQCGG